MLRRSSLFITLIFLGVLCSFCPPVWALPPEGAVLVESGEEEEPPPPADSDEEEAVEEDSFFDLDVDYIMLSASYFDTPFANEGYLGTFDTRIRICPYLSFPVTSSISKQRVSREVEGLTDSVRYTRATVSVHGGISLNLNTRYFAINLDGMVGGFTYTGGEELEDTFHERFGLKSSFQGLEVRGRASIDINPGFTFLHILGDGRYNRRTYDHRLEGVVTVTVWDDPESMINRIDIGGGYIYDRMKAPNLSEMWGAGAVVSLHFTDWAQVNGGLYYSEQEIYVLDEVAETFYGTYAYAQVRLLWG